ncbi:MAG: response regulator [Candidatus Kapabacteria bacterium]|nr:response regulator [Candidatus Kapabacteria bacterium]
MNTEYSALIVDDDVWMQRILSKTLQSYGFKKTYLASDGFDAIALAVEHVPTLIIMDIMMPELSGHLTMKIIKRIKSLEKVPVIMVSALSDTENLGIAIKSGIAGYISKPFTRATIYEKLTALFGKEKLDAIAHGDEMDETTEEIENYIMPELIDETPKVIYKTEDQSKELTEKYKADEKEKIESVKKMLLKSKK